MRFDAQLAARLSFSVSTPDERRGSFPRIFVFVNWILWARQNVVLSRRPGPFEAALDQNGNAARDGFQSIEGSTRWTLLHA